MGKKVEIFQIDSFTSTPFQGNPAGVCFADNLEEIEMMKIANEMNLAETAFISRGNVGKSPNEHGKTEEGFDYKLRWFTPTVEVDLCGHGTIASLHYLNEHNLLYNNSQIQFSTLSGILKCGISDGKYFMQIPIYAMENFAGNKEEIIKTLGINYSDEIKFVLLENTNLYIYFKTLEQLKSLDPDFAALTKLINNKKEFGGIAAFTLETIDKNNSAHLRYFAPAHGINEDTVTGSANGPLLLVLKHLGFIKDEDDINLTFEQGDFKGRPGRVEVNYSKNKNELFISGSAVTVLKGEILL